MTQTSKVPGAGNTSPSGGSTGGVATAGEKPKFSIKLMLCLLFDNLSVYVLWGAIPGLMLQSQIQQMDPANKVAIVGTVTMIGSFGALVAQPVAGALSDRTRSKFGRRAPWMVGATLVGALALVGLGVSNSVVSITIAWLMVQISYNFLQGPLSAILPDRIPSSQRGRFSMVMGFGMMGGAMGGQVFAANFAQTHGARFAGYMIMAGFAIIVTVLLVVLNPDKSSKDIPREKFDLAKTLRGFWVSPRKHPDFGWAFLARLLLMVGYFAVSLYQLYILQDYIGLSYDAAVPLVATMGIVGMVGNFIAMSVSGPWSDKIGRRKIFVIVASFLLAGAVLIPLALPTVTGMIIYTLVAGLCFGIYMAVDTALMTEVLPSSDDAAKDLGVLNIAACLPQVLGPGIASVIVSTFGGGVSYQPLFVFACIMAIVGGLAVFPIKSVK